MQIVGSLGHSGLATLVMQGPASAETQGKSQRARRKNFQAG